MTACDIKRQKRARIASQPFAQILIPLSLFFEPPSVNRLNLPDQNRRNGCIPIVNILENPDLPMGRDCLIRFPQPLMIELCWLVKEAEENYGRRKIRRLSNITNSSNAC